MCVCVCEGCCGYVTVCVCGLLSVCACVRKEMSTVHTKPTPPKVLNKGQRPRLQQTHTSDT